MNQAEGQVKHYTVVGVNIRIKYKCNLCVSFGNKEHLFEYQYLDNFNRKSNFTQVIHGIKYPICKCLLAF